MNDDDTAQITLAGAARRRLETLAAQERRDSADILHDALDQYAERGRLWSAFRHDALQAWEAYRRTGLHATGDEVDAWLARLEAGDEIDPPECHT